MRGRALGLAVVGALWGGGLAAQVVPDGTTATGVVIGPDGRITVGIAPTGRNGISRNSFTSFDVPAAGVDLDNRDAVARTILNEVTGADPSRISGEVAVLGQKAHVILANPNGIVIDGGRFVNTGRLALTTGKAGLADQQIAPGIFQSNVTARVTGGTIQIQGGGLAGQMDAVDLIAEQIRIDGPVTLTGEEAALSLQAGHTETTFDSSLVPGNTSLAWSHGSALDGGPPGVIVEIEGAGLLSASRIGIVVNGAGAGVRHAGQALAGAYGFTLSAQGDVTLQGGKIAAEAGGTVALDLGGTLALSDAEVTASGNLLASAAEVQIASPTRQSALTAENGSLVMTGTGGLHAMGALLQGGQLVAGAASPSGQVARGAVTLGFGGAVSLANQGAFQATVFGLAGDVVLASGSDILNDKGQILSNGEIAMTAAGSIVNQTAQPGPGELQVTTTQRRRPLLAFFLPLRSRHHLTYQGVDPGGEQVAVITALKGIALQAGGLIVNNGGQINANGGNLSLTAAGVENRSVALGAMDLTLSCGRICTSTGASTLTFAEGLLRTSGDLQILADDRFANQGGEVLAFGKVAITADSVTTSALRDPLLVTRPGGLYNFWRGTTAWIALRDRLGEIIAQAGDIVLTTLRPVVIEGGVLEASGTVVTPAGQVVLRQAQQMRLSGSLAPIGLFSGLPLMDR